ncbi:ESX secretion-associated protein EspG [Umezawaea beigongshangensis]|uniref:ESX secretion-associated protein EspG n=1 Tax=Umezawaea beigongshangensis TaxID=2780383 RepID=UPI0018F12319|nr:ESX secretion-associated protein EspG [Umezawaea beigongshangensis]
MTVIGLDLGENDVREPLVVSALEFDVLWEHLRLESLPLVLKVPSPGRTTDERARIVRGVWDELERRGLGGPRSLDPQLEDLLTLLNRPVHEVDGRVWLGRRVRVLAASTTSSAALAVLDGDRLTLRPASVDGLPREALSVLPQAPAGPGHSVTLPSADLDAAARSASSPQGLEAALRERGTRAEDAKVLTEMFTDAGHRGQFGAAARDRFGKRLRPDRVVSFFDTPRGRYLQMRRAAEGQQPWSTVSPVDHRRLVQHLTELLQDARTSAIR